MFTINQDVIDKAKEVRNEVREKMELKGVSDRLNKAQEMIPLVAAGHIGQFKAYEEMTRMIITSSDGKREYYTSLNARKIECSCPDYKYQSLRSGRPVPCKHCMVLYAITLQTNSNLKKLQAQTETNEEVQAVGSPKKVYGKRQS